MENVRAAIGDWAQDVKKNAGWLVALGVVTVIAGILSIVSPMVGGLGVIVLVGIAMVIGGVSHEPSASYSRGVVRPGRPGAHRRHPDVRGRPDPRDPARSRAGEPDPAARGLPARGRSLRRTFLAFQPIRPENGWGSTLFSAAIGVLLGILLLQEWPLSGLWAIGTLVGVNLLFTGFSIISIGSAARGLAKKVA